MLTSNGKLSTKATTKAAPATTLPRYPGNVPTDFEPPKIGESKTGFTVQRRRVRSSFEFVTDDISLAPLGLRADTMSRGRPHAGHLFNSMPCAWAQPIRSALGLCPASKPATNRRDLRALVQGMNIESPLWSVLLWVSIRRGRGYVLSNDDVLNVPRKAKYTSAVACGFPESRHFDLRSISVVPFTNHPCWPCHAMQARY
jgi:hypothetical protein